jgi:hypothetical protein
LALTFQYSLLDDIRTTLDATVDLLDEALRLTHHAACCLP